MKTRIEAIEALRQAEIDLARHAIYGDRAVEQVVLARQAVKYDPNFEADITAIMVCEHVTSAYRLSGK